MPRITFPIKTVLESIAQWGLNNIKGTEARLKAKSK